jgi:PAS domain S-box-containing protein
MQDTSSAEDALRQSEARYRKLLGSIDQGFCVIQMLLDAQGQAQDYRFIETNGVFERQTGLAAAVGRTARELVPGLEPHWIERYGQVALTGQAVRFTEQSFAMGRWFDVYATPTGEPQSLQVALLFNDITDRMRTEECLRRNEERYRAFVANSTEGIWRMEFEPAVDTRLPSHEQVSQVLRNGRFAECNDAFARMYGYGSADELVGQGLGLMFKQDSPATAAYLRVLVDQGWRATELESMEHDREGNPLYFANSLWGVVQEGMLVRAWGTQRDVTDRKRAELALVESDQRKDRFLATLAHELRNPLAPMRSAVELLRIKGPHVPELVRGRDIICKQVTHLTRLIEDLLDISRITRDKLELRMARVAIADVVNGALESTRPQVEAGGHPLHLELPRAPLHVEGDAVRLVQVLGNLLANAARYSPPGTPIWLWARADNGEVVLGVRDLGQGIAPHQLPRVFDMFYQGGEGLDRGHGGLGIGLSLVQRLTQLHGGRVEARSDGLNQGSEFIVRLPMALELGREAAAAPPPAVAAAAERTVRRVLVVDDNQDSADTLAEVLRLMGCEAETAYDGVEGVEKAQQLRPDALVLDLGMPRMNGFEACRRIRSQPWGRDMKIVAVSGWGQQEDRRRSAEAGFDAHLVKPVVPDALLEVLDGLPQRAREPA